MLQPSVEPPASLAAAWPVSRCLWIRAVSSQVTNAVTAIASNFGSQRVPSGRSRGIPPLVRSERLVSRSPLLASRTHNAVLTVRARLRFGSGSSQPVGVWIKRPIRNLSCVSTPGVGICRGGLGPVGMGSDRVAIPRAPRLKRCRGWGWGPVGSSRKNVTLNAASLECQVIQ